MPLRMTDRPSVQSSSMQQAHEIAIVLTAYAQDHNGHFPEGKTSTEVFQHLLDEAYINDPRIFYVGNERWSMPGKVLGTDNHLKPKNVCWDVTGGADANSPDNLPVVFLHGYQVTYQPNASAVLVDQSPRTWSQWWNGPAKYKTFIAVAFKDNTVRVFPTDSQGAIPNFIPADFDPKGRTYRQLTP